MVEEMKVLVEQEKESQDLSDSLRQGKFSLQAYLLWYFSQRLSVASGNHKER